MRARIFSIFGLISVPCLLAAQPASEILGPVSGYIFDGSARSLRPVLGMPGASLLGNPIDFGFDVAAVSVAPRQDAAFVTASDGTFHFFRIQSGAPSEMVVNGMATPDRVVFSPSGTAAALQTGGSIQILSGLPGSPAIASTIDARAFTGLTSLAVSDDGNALLMATANSIEIFSGAADQGKFADTTGLALVAFAPNGHDAAIVDRGGAGVVLYRGLTGATPVAPADGAIQSASAMVFSTDGQRLLITNPAAQSVTTFDLTAGSRADVACTCSPSGLSRMGDLFRLNEPGSGPLWLLDARPATATLTFIPAEATAPVRRRPTGPEGPRRGLAPLNQPGTPSPRVQSAQSE